MFKAGDVAVRLGFLTDESGFDRWERRLSEAQRESRREIEARLGGKLDPQAFDAYFRQLERAEQRTKRRDAFKASLGASFDPKAFNAYERQLGRTERDNERLRRSNRTTGLSFGQMASRAVAAGAAIGIAYKGAEAAHRAIENTEALGKEVLTLSKSFGMSERAATAWAVQARARGADGAKLTMAFKGLSTQVRNATVGIDAQSDAVVKLREKNALRLKQAEDEAATSKDQEGAQRRLVALKERLAASEDELTHKSLAQVKAFEQLGISQEELRRHGNDIDWVIRRVSAGMGELPAGTDRAALAARLFGRTWTTIFPLVRDGTDAMDEQLGVARKYGIDFGEGTEGIKRMIAAQRELKIAQLALQVQFTQHVEPTLIRVMEAWARMAQVIGDPKLSLDEKVEQINRRLQPLLTSLERTFNRWVPKLASVVAHAVPTIVEAFINAFLNADAWGKVAIGAWLITKLGGWAAIRGIGKKVGATIAAEVATGAAVGQAGAAAGGAGAAAGGAGAAAGGGALARILGSRAGQAITGGSVARLLGTRVLPVVIAYDVTKQATTGSSPVRDYANTRGSYRGFELPTTGGGFKSMMRDLEHWSFQQPEWETKARKLGDTIAQLGGRLDRLSSASLRQLGRDAREAAANFEPARKALGAFADDIGGELQRRFRGALDALGKGAKWQTPTTFLDGIKKQWLELPASARGAGAESIVQLARAMERQGRLPRGATNKIIGDLEKRWDGLRPYLRSAGMDSMAELDRTLQDRRVVRTVQDQIDTIARTWADAPKLAKTTAGNARSNWQKEMDFLSRKIRTSTGEQRRTAVQQWTQLQRSGAGAASATDRAFALMVRGIGDSFGGLTDVVGGSLDSIVGVTNTALTAFGIAPIKFSVSGLITTAGSLLGRLLGGGGNKKAAGGWIGEPGARGHDDELVLAGRGEAFLNNPQQGPVEVGLALSKALGVQPFGSLDELFAATTSTRHAFAAGGKVSGPNFYGHPSNVTPQLRSLLGLVERQWPQLVVTSTTDHSTSTSSGGRSFHVDGAAVDLAASPSYMLRVADWIKSSGLYRQLAEGIHNPNLAVKGGQLVDGPSFFASGGVWGQHVNHIHLAILGALGALAGFKKVGKVKVTGPAGALRSLAQGVVDRVRGGANTYLDRQSTTTAHGAAGGGAGGSYSKSALMALWRRVGGAAPAARTAGAVALAESAGNPDAINHNADGSIDRGLWQINSVHGALSTLDPVANARAAVAISGNGRNWRPWVTYNTGAYRQFFGRGGIVRALRPRARLARFGGGGRVASALAGGGRRQKMMRGIGALEARIDWLNNDFTRAQRRFDLSEEEWIVPGDETTPPTIDEKALAKHTEEQQTLLGIRVEILGKSRALANLINRTLELYRQVRARVQRAIDEVRDRLGKLKGRKGKQAAKSRDSLGAELDALNRGMANVDDRIGVLAPKARDIPWDIEDAKLDVLELRGQIKALNPKAQLAEAIGDWTPPPAEPPPDDGGGDPAPGDPVPAAPTPAEIAQAAAEQLAAFASQQKDLFATFGSNFVASGGILGPGGMVSPSAALRGFGAFGGDNPGSSSPRVEFTQHITMMAPPPDPHVWAQQQRFEVEAALG